MNKLKNVFNKVRNNSYAIYTLVLLAITFMQYTSMIFNSRVGYAIETVVCLSYFFYEGIFRHKKTYVYARNRKFKTLFARMSTILITFIYGSQNLLILFEIEKNEIFRIDQRVVIVVVAVAYSVLTIIEVLKHKPTLYDLIPFFLIPGIFLVLGFSIAYIGSLGLILTFISFYESEEGLYFKNKLSIPLSNTEKKFISGQSEECLSELKAKWGTVKILSVILVGTFSLVIIISNSDMVNQFLKWTMEQTFPIGTKGLINDIVFLRGIFRMLLLALIYNCIQLIDIYYILPRKNTVQKECIRVYPIVTNVNGEYC